MKISIRTCVLILSVLTFVSATDINCATWECETLGTNAGKKFGDDGFVCVQFDLSTYINKVQNCPDSSNGTPVSCPAVIGNILPAVPCIPEIPVANGTLLPGFQCAENEQCASNNCDIVCVGIRDTTTTCSYTNFTQLCDVGYYCDTTTSACK
jgi:hypothetical protein